MATEAMSLAEGGIAPTPFEIPGATGHFRIQILNEDAARGVVTSIVHLPPGGRIPAHFHRAGSEMHYVLEGDLIERGQSHGSGAFLTHAAGVVHGPHESRSGARVLTVQQWQSRNGEFDFQLAEGGAPQDDASPVATAAMPGDGEAPKAAEGRRDAAADSLGKGYG